MSLGDFLSAFGQSFRDDYGGLPGPGPLPKGGDPYSGGAQVPQQAGLPVQPAAPTTSQPALPVMPQRRGGVRDFLGKIGDAILTGAGGEPIYGPKMEQEALSEAMVSYLGNTDAQLSEIARRSPDLAFRLMKLKQDSMPKPQEPTALMQNIEYLRKLYPSMTDQQLAEVAQYAIAAPRLYPNNKGGFDPDPNYPFTPGWGAGGGAPQEPASPQGGTSKVIGGKTYYQDPASGKWYDSPIGGGAIAGTGGFP